MIERDPVRRLEQLRRKLNARTNSRGEPMPGFADNARAIRAEISRLEKAQGEKVDGGR